MGPPQKLIKLITFIKCIVLGTPSKDYKVYKVDNQVYNVYTVHKLWDPSKVNKVYNVSKVYKVYKLWDPFKG